MRGSRLLTATYQVKAIQPSKFIELNAEPTDEGTDR